MARLRVQSFAVSIDGFGAGPDQSLDNPLGIGGRDGARPVRGVTLHRAPAVPSAISRGRG